MAQLIGSEKQIAWAEDIRAAVIERVEQMDESDRTEFAQWIARETSAKFFIEQGAFLKLQCEDPMLIIRERINWLNILETMDAIEPTIELTGDANEFDDATITLRYIIAMQTLALAGKLGDGDYRRQKNKIAAESWNAKYQAWLASSTDAAFWAHKIFLYESKCSLQDIRSNSRTNG